MKYILIFICFLMTSSAIAEQKCAPIFQGKYRKLNSKETIELCKLTSGKTVLVVNTASYCGFTGQFSDLQATYTEYKDKDFIVIGFPSDDFYQEDSNQEKTAKICYINYGVTFPITEPVSVRGKNAAAVFKEATKQTNDAPGWNFHKYLVDPQGNVVGSWSASSKSTDKKIKNSIEKTLKKASKVKKL